MNVEQFIYCDTLLTTSIELDRDAAGDFDAIVVKCWLNVRLFDRDGQIIVFVVVRHDARRRWQHAHLCRERLLTKHEHPLTANGVAVGNNLHLAEIVVRATFE